MESAKGIAIGDLAAAVFVTALWGANFSFIKLGLSELDPFAMTCLRFTFSALPLVFFLPRPRLPMSIVAVYGVIFGAGIWGVVNIAIAIGLAPGLAALLMQFSPFFTVLMSKLIFRESIASHQYVGMAFAMVGLALIISSNGVEAPIGGIALALCGALSWSVSNLIIKAYKPTHMLAFIAWSSLFSVPALLLLTLAAKGPTPLANIAGHIDVPVIASVISQAYVTTVFGYWVWNRLVAKYSAAQVAPLSLLVPIFGVAISVLVYDQVLSATRAMAAVLIVLGVGVFVVWPKLASKRPLPELSSTGL